MEKAYRFRLYPNKEQQLLMEKAFGCCRFVYNRLLAIRQERFAVSGESLGKYDCITMLPQLKKEFPLLVEVDSTALQTAVDEPRISLL